MTWYCIPKDHNLNAHCLEPPISQKKEILNKNALEKSIHKYNRLVLNVNEIKSETPKRKIQMKIEAILHRKREHKDKQRSRSFGRIRSDGQT
jgi:hypothetical protein